VDKVDKAKIKENILEQKKKVNLQNETFFSLNKTKHENTLIHLIHLIQKAFT